MKTFTLYIMSALLPISAFARIGETEAQIEKRYGEPVRADTKALLLLTKLYRIEDLRVAVSFVDGVSECEHFSKSEGGKLSEQELDVLLKANAIDTKHWLLKLDTGSQKMWAIADDQCGDSPDCVLRFAAFSTFDGQLIISSKKFLEWRKTLAAEAAKKKLKDF